MDKQKAKVLKKITQLGVVAGVFFLLIAGTQIFETNQAGHFQIKQAAVTGKMSVRMEPGLYGQMFGDIWTYKQVATVGFGKEEEGEGQADLEAIPVIFNDGSRAKITGLVRVKLPTDPDKALALKSEYPNGYNHFIKSGILPIVRNAVKLSANLRSAQEAYTTLALFQQAIEDQLKNGPYLTKSDTVKVTKATGDTEVMKVTKIVYDKKTGEPLRLNNRFQELGCDVTDVVVGVPDFDEKVENMIARRKDEAMKTELAKQEAIRAKQDAITIAEKGKAAVAKAEAEALVQKKKEVVEAEKQKEVAELEAKKKFEVAKFAAKEALEEAKKIKAQGMAKAAANRALVAAGLTPRERAEFRVKAITAAFDGWSKRPVPTTIMGMGGSGKSGSALTELLSADAALNLMEKFNKPSTIK